VTAPRLGGAYGTEAQALPLPPLAAAPAHQAHHQKTDGVDAGAAGHGTDATRGAAAGVRGYPGAQAGASISRVKTSPENKEDCGIPAGVSHRPTLRTQS
jgi:hypothetical protein